MIVVQVNSKQENITIAGHGGKPFNLASTSEPGRYGFDPEDAFGSGVAAGSGASSLSFAAGSEGAPSSSLPVETAGSEETANSVAFSTDASGDGATAVLVSGTSVSTADTSSFGEDIMNYSILVKDSTKNCNGQEGDV